MKLKHWRTIGAVIALIAVSGCYAHGAVGRTALNGDLVMLTANPSPEANRR